MSDVSMKDAFNAISAYKIAPSLLRVSNGVSDIYYDFAQRLVQTSSQGGYRITPFSELDRESLVAAHDRLVELGGKPPALPAEAPTLNKPSRGLNP